MTTRLEKWIEDNGVQMQAVWVPARVPEIGCVKDETWKNHDNFIVTLWLGGGNPADGLTLFYSTGAAFPFLWADRRPKGIGTVTAAMGVEAENRYRRTRRLTERDDKLRQAVIAAYRRAAPIDLVELLQNLADDFRMVEDLPPHEFAEDLYATADSAAARVAWHRIQQQRETWQALLGRGKFAEFMDVALSGDDEEEEEEE